jgi:hypothetical protein
MEHVSLGTVTGFALVFSLFVIPLARVFHRAGWNGWMALLFPIPIVGIMLLWVFAFRHWPALDGKSIQDIAAGRVLLTLAPHWCQILRRRKAQTEL